MVHLKSHHIQYGSDWIMLGPAVQFREFKLPLGTHWKDNKHFYKGIFLLDWSGEQINNSEQRQIVRQEVEVIVLNLLCKCLRTSNWLCSFSVLVRPDFEPSGNFGTVHPGDEVSWLNNRSALLWRVWSLLCLCFGLIKMIMSFFFLSVKNKGFHSRGWNNKHFGSVNLFKWL